MEPLEIIKYKKHNIIVSQSEYDESPNEWGNDDQFLIFDHQDLCVERKGFDPTDIFEDGEKVKGYHVFRCYAYIHSGVVLAVEHHNFPDASWDVSFKGFWLIKREKGTWTREDALKAAQGLCQTWNTYLSGDIYQYRIENSKEENIDSCSGFYGNDGKEQMIAEAMEIIDYALAKAN